MAKLGLHDHFAGFIHQRGAHMTLAFEAGHHLAQGDRVLDIALQRVTDRPLRAPEGGMDFNLRHRFGMQQQQRAAAQKRQHQQKRDRTQDPELKRHGATIQPPGRRT